MKHTKEIKRTYVLGDYKNLVVTGGFYDIPTEVWRDSELLKLMDSILLGNIELIFRKYMVMAKSLPIEPEKAVEILTDAQDKQMLRLIGLMNGNLNATIEEQTEN